MKKLIVDGDLKLSEYISSITFSASCDYNEVVIKTGFGGKFTHRFFVTSKEDLDEIGTQELVTAKDRSLCSLCLQMPPEIDKNGIPYRLKKQWHFDEALFEPSKKADSI